MRHVVPLAASLALAFLGSLPAGAQSPQPAPATAPPAIAPSATTRPAARTPREPSVGQLAARERQKKCGAEWRTAKASGKTDGLKWPQYWSRCNARLKGGSA